MKESSGRTSEFNTGLPAAGAVRRMKQDVSVAYFAVTAKNRWHILHSF